MASLCSFTFFVFIIFRSRSVFRKKPQRKRETNTSFAEGWIQSILRSFRPARKQVPRDAFIQNLVHYTRLPARVTARARDLLVCFDFITKSTGDNRRELSFHQIVNGMRCCGMTSAKAQRRFFSRRRKTQQTRAPHIFLPMIHGCIAFAWTEWTTIFYKEGKKDKFQLVPNIAVEDQTQLVGLGWGGAAPVNNQTYRRMDQTGQVKGPFCWGIGMWAPHNQTAVSSLSMLSLVVCSLRRGTNRKLIVTIISPDTIKDYTAYILVCKINALSNSALFTCIFSKIYKYNKNTVTSTLTNDLT